MRLAFGFLPAAVLAAAVAGCFTPEAQQLEPAGPVGPPTGNKERTLEYWGKVRDLMQMRLQSNVTDMRQLADTIRKQADTIRKLAIDGVDMELVTAANAVAGCQEKMLKAADEASYSPTTLRTDPELKTAYIAAGRQLTAAQARLKSLAPRLSARYSVPFPPIDDSAK